MKVWKRISRFCVLPVFLLGAGIVIGHKCSQFFYPGDPVEKEVRKQPPIQQEIAETPVSGGMDGCIDADTEWFIEEMDIRKNTALQIQSPLPAKYIGMDRQEFLAAMKEYELSPPLSELERGFVSLEVKSFSKEKILVRMNYVYVAPTDSFYLMAEDHALVVYCEDKKTVFMKTNIRLEQLPEEQRQKVICGMHVQGEQALYDFLEAYSS